MLDKVRKLLAKAEDPACTPAEAEAFTDKAAELIAKYGVDAALLAEADPSRDPVGDRVIDIPSPYATEKCTLLSEVATELRCRAVRRLRRGSDGQGVLDAPVRSRRRPGAGRGAVHVTAGAGEPSPWPASGFRVTSMSRPTGGRG